MSKKNRLKSNEKGEVTISETVSLKVERNRKIKVGDVIFSKESEIHILTVTFVDDAFIGASTIMRYSKQQPNSTVVKECEGCHKYYLRTFILTNKDIYLNNWIVLNSFKKNLFITPTVVKNGKVIFDYSSHGLNLKLEVEISKDEKRLPHAIEGVVKHGGYKLHSYIHPIN